MKRSDFKKYAIGPLSEQKPKTDRGINTGIFYHGVEIPFFADMVLSDKTITKKAKQKFYNKILIPYLEDEDFRKTVDKYYMLFFNKEYYGIFKDSNDINNIGTYMDDRYVIQISDDEYEYKYNKIIIDSNTNVDIKGHSYYLPFNVECYLTNVPFPTSKDIVFKGNMLFDTGCSCSDLLNYDYWDFCLGGGLRRKQSIYGISQ